MSLEQQRFRQIYTQKALDGDYAGGLALGGLALGGARGVPKRCPKGSDKVCKKKKRGGVAIEEDMLGYGGLSLGGVSMGGVSMGGAAKGSHCKKGAMKMQPSGVKRCEAFTEGRKPIKKEKEVKQKRQPSNWVIFLKEYARVHGISYAEALQHAKKGPDGKSALRPLYLNWLGDDRI